MLASIMVGLLLNPEDLKSKERRRHWLPYERWHKLVVGGNRTNRRLAFVALFV